MSTPYMGEIKITSFNFAPKGWALANGQFLAINQNQALFSLFGTSFGGNGQTTFALPDFRGRTPIHAGNSGGFVAGQAGGQEFHTLTIQEMPTHFHALQGSSAPATLADPVGSMLADVNTKLYKDSSTNPTTLFPATVTNAGGSQPHENRQPYLVLSFIIALQGIFPSRT
jgi:microcystin-dependent protein